MWSASAPDSEQDLSSVAAPRTRTRAPARRQGPTRKGGGAEREKGTSARHAHCSAQRNAPRFVGEVSASSRQWATPCRRQESRQTQTAPKRV